MTENFLKTKNGVEIYYKFFPNPGPTLVLIHGGSGSSASWNFQVEALNQAGYQLVVPDLRGHGQSSRGDNLDFFSVDNNVQDLNEILTKEKVEKTILVGHSFGGQIAQRFYQLFPDKVERLILISCKFEETRSKLILGPMEFFLKLVFLVGGKGKPTTEYPDYTQHIQTADFNPFRLLADIKVCSLKTYAGTLIVGNNFDNKHFRDIKIPTLIIHGKNDIIFPHDVMEKIAAEIDNFDFVTVHTNHVILINKPEEVNQAIIKFLKEN